MSVLIRHARGVAIALVVLAVSSTAVLGARGLMPTAATDGLAIAAEAAGKTVPAIPDAAVPETETQTETSDAEAEAEGTAETEAADAAEGTHGALVSEAAQMETPAGFENHGAFVSCVAHLNRGQWAGTQPAVPVVLAELTPERCEALAAEAAAAKDAAKAARAAERETAQAERAAARATRAAERAAEKAARAAARSARGS